MNPQGSSLVEAFIAFFKGLKPEFLHDYPPVLERMLPFLIGLMAIEVFLYKRVKKKDFPTKELLSSLAIAAAYGFSKLLAVTVHAAAFIYLWDNRLFTIEMNSVTSWVAIFFAVEFLYYWFHRFSHRNKWYWSSHAVHHTPENMFFAVAFQLSLTSVLTPVLPFMAAFIVFGFHPGALIFAYNTNLIFQFFLHTETINKLPRWIEYVFNTPSHHRVHHASNDEYIDKNYGGMLIVFDRMFGTFYEERTDIKIKYGLIKGHGSLNPFMIAFYPTYALLRDIYRAKGIMTKLKYFVTAPDVDLTEHKIEEVMVVGHLKDPDVDISDKVS